MRKCAFLTMEDLTDFVVDDALAYPALREIGWETEAVPWRRDVDWNRYEVVIIRSTWDYQQDPERFFQVLRKIDSSGARLENPIPIVRWNLKKSYLRDLESEGIAIPTTLWRDALDRQSIMPLFDELASEEIVIKPLISANADHTYRLRRPLSDSLLEELEGVFGARECLVQPFLPSIVTEGEFSLFFFAGQHSHTILKTPKERDFRVQEEHGGIIRSVEAEPALYEAARRVMAEIDPQPLYGRVDFARLEAEKFVVMEVELIEPALYFRMDPESPRRFAEALERWIS